MMRKTTLDSQPHDTLDSDMKTLCVCFLQEYGDIDYVNVLRDKTTGDSKGLAYVKYHRAYHAALALESCDSSKPRFLIFSESVDWLFW